VIPTRADGADADAVRADGSVEPPSRRFDARIFVIIGLVVLPMVVALVSLLGTHWSPTSDDAIEVLRIRDVGGRHTPLIGMDSRLRWSHPGPLLFWLLAPFRWVGGNTGILIGVVLLNAAVLAGALLVARRRGGAPLMVLVGVVALLLMRALGATILVDPWVPWVSVLPFLLYVLLAWSLADRDFATLPWLVVVGSFVAQTYIGYVPLVALVGVAALALMWWRRADEPATQSAQPVRRSIVIAATAGVVLWLPPVIQQFTGDPGNLGEIVDYFRDPPEKFVGWAFGYGLMGRELRVTGPWINGNDTSALGFVFTDGTVMAILLVVAVLVLGLLAWTRRPSAARFAVLMFAAVWIGVVAGARVTGVAGPYQVRWWWVIAGLVCCSLVWSAWSRFVPDRVAPVLVDVGLVVILVLAVVVSFDTASVRVPEDHQSDAVAAMGHEVARHLGRDQRYLVTSTGTRDFGGVLNGMYLELLSRGFDVRVSDAFAHAVGSWRVAKPGETDQVLTIVGGDSFAEYQPGPGTAQVAAYDPLDPGERARASELEARIRSRVGTDTKITPADVDNVFGRAALVQAGVDADTIAQLRALRAQGMQYALYAGR
jgi:hypothetical protein